MLTFLRKVFLRLAFIVEKFQHRIASRSDNSSPAIQAARVVQWFKDNGDETLRLDYPLNGNSIVFDLGGYKGEFARDIFCKYNCSIYVFEPIPEFYNEIVKRFINNSKVKPFSFGLGNTNCKAKINLEENASSLLNKGAGNYKEIEIRSLNDFISEYNITKIDLVKLNIEGAEYELLESIIEAGNIKKIINLQVQFHDFVIKNAKLRKDNICKILSITHRLTYHYEFVWENWHLKEG